MISSSLPPEYNISYEYDSDGLPVKATMTSVEFPKSELIILEYKYEHRL